MLSQSIEKIKGKILLQSSHILGARNNYNRDVQNHLQHLRLLWGYASSCAYYQDLLIKTVLRNKCSIYLYSLSRHVSAYLMAILRGLVENTKYKGSVVEIEASFNILYDSPEDGHQIGRKHVTIKSINKKTLEHLLRRTY
jgi:hypothetical protein